MNPKKFLLSPALCSLYLFNLAIVLPTGISLSTPSLEDMEPELKVASDDIPSKDKK